jgi:predicted glycogen debranching enzyme
MIKEEIGMTEVLSQDENQATQKEWLEVNGLGGYASSTLLNCHSRKYHGLLISANLDSTERYNLLSKFDEEIILEDENETYLLSTHYYLPDIYVTDLDKGIIKQDFCETDYPKWTYQIKDINITKELVMLHGSNSTLLKYTINSKSKRNIKLKLKPLLACRNFHHLTKENYFFNPFTQEIDGGVSIKAYESIPELLLQTTGSYEFTNNFTWYKNFSYQEEKNRGYDHSEDLACPGYFTIKITNNKSFFVSASAEVQVIDHEAVWNEEIKRRKNLVTKSKAPNKNDVFVKALEKAAESFIIKTKENQLTIIAGYHWFGSWGRDTMISLPGLFLKTNYQNDFKKVLRHFLDFKKDGLIPNVIGPDKERSAYNSVDASLWLFWAIQQFAKETQKTDWIQKEFWEDLKEIFNAYANNHSSIVKCTENGLLDSGSEQESMSWMDACLDGKSVIPRYGYLVEINALWYNACSYVKELAIKFKDPIAKDAETLKNKILNSFTETFYCPEKRYLADYVRGDYKNFQIRPNQLIALSLPYSPVSDEISANVVEVCIQHLFTNAGLRTLSPQDSDYHKIYSGDTHSRDRAYHNGTVWPWLLGPLGDALLRVDKKSKPRVRNMVETFASELLGPGAGSIAEIYDGDFPHLARGCISQAWSVAEIRRLYLLSN